MPEYELRLRFTAADAHQADRLAQAWADTCAAEYGTRYAGLTFVSDQPEAVKELRRMQHGAVANPVAGKGS